MFRKKRFRKVLSLFLIFAMVLGNGSMTALAAYPPVIDGVPVLEDMGGEFTLQVPNLAYDEESIILVWSKPEYYDNIAYFNIYQDGDLIGNTDYQSYSDSDSRAFQNISAFYQEQEFADYHTNILIHNYTVKGLSADTEYEFVVASVNSSGVELDYSNPIIQKTTKAPDIFNIEDYGAVEGDDESLAAANTLAIQSAIDACAEDGKVVVPAGTWITGAIWLKSNMTFEIQAGGTLLGSAQQGLYPTNYWVYNYSTDERSYSLINAHTYDYGSIKNIRLVGEGVLDGNGWTLSSTRDRSDLAGNALTGYFAGSNSTVSSGGILAKNQAAYGSSLDMTAAQAYAIRSNLATFRGVDGIFIEGLTARNPANHGFVNLFCNDVVYTNVINDTYDANNGDGFEFGDTQNILVFNNFNHTGDDAINFASGQGQAAVGEEPTGNAWIFNNYVQEGHGGVVTGSHTGGWIQNILAEDNIFYTTDTGLRAKTNTPMGGGARYILFRDNVLESIDGDAAFIFTSSYTDANATIAYEPAEEISTFSNMVIQNCTVRFTGSSGDAKGPIVIAGNGDVTEVYHNNIRFDNVKIDAATNRPAVLNYAKDITFHDLTLTTTDADHFWTKIQNSQGIVISGSTELGGALITAMTAPTWQDGAAVTEVSRATASNASSTSVNQVSVTATVSNASQAASASNAGRSSSSKGSKASASNARRSTVKKSSLASTGNAGKTTTASGSNASTSVTTKNSTATASNADLTITNYDLNPATGAISVGLQWTDALDVSLYVIFVDGIDRGKNNLTSTTASITLADLSPAVDHKTEIYAQNATGQRSETALEYVIEAAALDLNAPVVPDDTTVSGDIQPGYTWQTIKWNAATDDIGVSAYIVIANGEERTVPVEKLGLSSGVYSYVLGGLRMSTDYEISIKAVDAAGNTSDAWGDYQFTTRDAYSTSTPYWNSGDVLQVEFVAAAASGTVGTLTLSWPEASVESAQSILGYRIYINGQAINAAATFSLVNGKFTTAALSYTINDIDFSEIKTIEVYPGSESIRLSVRGTDYVEVPFYVWGGTALSSTQATTSDTTWKTRVFGQSTDVFFNSSGLTAETLATDPAYIRFNTELNSSGGIERFDNNYVRDLDGNTIADGNLASSFQMESRGGKIANAHDGITFYYTELSTDKNFKLSADIYINQIGLLSTDKGNGQEGIGLMVRDVIGDARKDPPETGFEELTAASNLAAARFSKNSSSVTTFNLYERNGVTERYGTASSAVNTQSFGNNSYAVGTTYNVTLERTDDNFTTTLTDIDGNVIGTKTSKWGADIVGRIESDTMYVGFFASRNVWAEFSNVSLIITDADTTATAPYVPAKTAAVSVLSSPDSASDEYVFMAKMNYDGKVSLKQNDTLVVANYDVEAYQEFIYVTTLATDSTLFTLSYSPGNDSPTQAVITSTLTVTKNQGIANPLEIYVSTDGSSAAVGTLENPTDIKTAIKYLAPGGTIYMLPGIYTTDIIINPGASGLNGSLKTIRPYSGNVVLTGKAITITGHYWHLIGIEVDGGGVRVSTTASNNILERLVVHGNSDTGIQIGNGSGIDPRNWPENNLILNCESYNNKDASLINADGFAGKLGVGEGNVFRGCISHDNIDDGYDLYNKIENGPNMPILLENCIAYNNGKTFDGSISGAGNGFKLGGEGMPVAHIVKNCLSFNNYMDGFTCNFNPGELLLLNNTAYNNVRHNYIFRTNQYFEPENQGTFINNISARSDNGNTTADYISGNYGYANVFYHLNGDESSELFNIEDFESIAVPSSYNWDEDNNIVYENFLRLKNSSVYATSGEGGEYAVYMGALVPADSSHTPDPVDPTDPADPNVPTDPGDSTDSTDLSELNRLISEASVKVTQTSVYTRTSITVLQAALNAAKAAAEQADATQTEIDTAVSELQKALDSLKTITTTTNSSKSNSSSSASDNSVRWIQDAAGWRMKTAQGTYASNEWQLVDNTWYFFHANGYMATGWVFVNNKWYFLHENGAMATGWVFINGKWYYLNASGDMTYEPVLYQGIEYRFDQNGACINP